MVMHHAYVMQPCKQDVSLRDRRNAISIEYAAAVPLHHDDVIALLQTPTRPSIALR
jgi:hypothetical protein